MPFRRKNKVGRLLRGGQINFSLDNVLHFIGNILVDGRFDKKFLNQTLSFQNRL